MVCGAKTAPTRASAPDLFGLFVVNAFWCGACGPGGVGLMYFGNGFPATSRSSYGARTGRIWPARSMWRRTN